MANCIECGREIPEGELFCAECSRELVQIEKMAQPQGRLPAQKAPTKAAVRAPEKKQSGTHLPNGIKILIAVLAVIALAGIVFMLRQLISTNTLRAELRVREEALAARETEFDATQQTLDETRQQLSQAQLTISAQQEQITELQGGIAEAQSSANQTQYDMTAQRAQLEKLQQENETLMEQITALNTAQAELQDELDTLTEAQQTLEEENEALSEEKQKLTEENQTLKEKSSFMDSYVVFVEDDKSGLYHKYGCSAFKHKSFWAYSRKLAENFGYTACPKCFG